jgi:hypothetical protein
MPRHFEKFKLIHTVNSYLKHRLGAAIAAALLTASPPAAGAAIVAAEYYINGDPSPGNGVPITGFSPNDKASLVVDIPVSIVSALPQGVHLITVRFQDEEGDWSVAFTRSFSREDLVSPPVSAPLAAAEYYINVDPGPGNGIPVSLPSGKWTHSMAIDVPPSRIAALNTGFHWITGRVKNSNGDWSVAFTRGFLKEDLSAQPSALASHIEYRWFRNGTQVGATVRLDPAAPAEKITFDLLAGLRGLVDGNTYQLVATPYDTLGNQGISATASVEIETVDTDGDGLPDLWEMDNGLNPSIAADATLDSDGDGLSNLSEFTAKTDPTKADTSGDGIDDKLAISLGLNPLLQHSSISATLAGLASEDEVRALYPRDPILSRNSQSGKFDLRLGIQESGNLGTWQKLPVLSGDTRIENGELIFSFSGDQGSKFYRVASGAPSTP